jgi:hypothetical protein
MMADRVWAHFLPQMDAYRLPFRKGLIQKNWSDRKSTFLFVAYS